MDKQQITQPESLHYCPVASQAMQHPNVIAIESDKHNISYAQLNQHINSLSRQLLTLTLKRGDRLVCIAPNCLQLVLLQMTCLRNGFIFCPINPKFSQAEQEQRLALLDSDFMWSPEQANSLPLQFETTPQTNLQHPIKIDSTTAISIIFTSGSSGHPKAVMHHFQNHYYSALGSQTVIPLEKGDKNLLSLPIFHISGYATVMRTFLAGATLQISTNRINVSNLKQRQTTHLSLVSAQLQQLLNEHNFQQQMLPIKHLLLGGSTFPSKLLATLLTRGFTYHLSYGSTEMASQVATSTNSEQLQLLPYRQLTIKSGEIHLAGETRFIGYFSTKEKFQPMDKRIYFPSSDIGELTGNTLTIIGRKDRQFISGGENIQPEEIERVLLTFPCILQAYVLPLTDQRFGQRPIAFIKWENSPKIEQLTAFLKDKLITFKQPLHYFEFPPQEGIKLNPQTLIDRALELLLIN